MKVVYALTSDGIDIFSALTRISLASLRLANPDIEICLCCDKQTLHSLKAAANPLLREADEVKALATPDGSPGFRNRHIKTRLRLEIEGDFLYLDSDTLIRDDLAAIFRIDADLAAADNFSQPYCPDKIIRSDALINELPGWTFSSETYVNGGVLFMRDTAGAHRMAEDWHRKWLHYTEKMHTHRDQPALNAALAETQPCFHKLPPQYNAQFKRNIQAISGARIWHYYSSILKRPNTFFELLATEISLGMKLEKRHIEQMVQAPHPWRMQTTLGHWLFQRMLSRNEPRGWEYKLLKSGRPY